MRLYDLAEEYAVLMAAYEETDDPEEQAEILDEIDRVNEGIGDKSEMYARMMRSADASAKMVGEEIKRLQRQKKSYENLAARMKSGIYEAMKMANADKLFTSIGKWYIQKNPWSATVTDQDKIPAKYLVHQPDTVDKTALLRDFAETGELIDGVEFTQGEGVRFR